MLRKSVWQNLHNHFTHDTYPKKLYLTLYNYLDLKDCGWARRIQRRAQGGPGHSKAGTDRHMEIVVWAHTSTQSWTVLL